MYVIAGITGNTGSAAAEALLAEGHAVRGLTRNVKGAAAWADRVELAEVDLADSAALTQALTGAAGAYLLIPPSWTTPDYYAYSRPLIASISAAIRSAEVPRVVILSSVGAQSPADTGPIGVLRDLEQALDGVNGVTFLRPASFHENIGGSLEPASQGTLPVFYDLERVLPTVAAHDIGVEAARQLLIAPADAPAIVQLAGPDDHSQNDIAAHLGTLMGHDVKPMQLPADAIIEPLRKLGAGHIADLYAEMNRGVENGAVAFDTALPVRRGTTSLHTTLANMLAASAPA